MKAIFYLLPVILVFTYFGCKDNPADPGTETGEGELTVNGSVIDNTSGDPLSGVNILLLYGSESETRITNTQGNFSAELELLKVEEVAIISSLKGYHTDTSVVTVSGGNNLNVNIKLQQKTVGSDVAGEPSSIVLLSTSAQSIGVKESGSVETAIVTFEVRDSSGNAINIDNSVWVDFSLGGSPGGGEFISPTSVKTDNSGKAVVTVSSGTKAGVIQFVARINSNGINIESKPVNIAIHGGHPDENHLTVYPEYVNLPGLYLAGFEGKIIALVGDKYANPVKPLTAVYFTTSHAVIEGSALTNDLGKGEVTLVTGNPLPSDGWVTVTMSTADENYETISASTNVLFSGETIITAPETFNDIPYLGETTVNFSIHDYPGHPIAHNNRVTVELVEGEGVQLTGDISFTTVDTADPDAVHYKFKIKGTDEEEPLGTRTVAVNIKVTGPNGTALAVVSGIIH